MFRKIKNLFVRIINHIVLVEIVYARKVDLADKALIQDKYIFEYANEKDILALHKYDSEISDKKIKQLLKRKNENHKWVILCKDINTHDIAGYFCLSEEDTYESGIKTNITVPDNSIYFFDDYVVKRYRRCGIHSASLAFRVGEAVCMNKKECIVVIYATNKESRKHYEHSGFRKKEIIIRSPIKKGITRYFVS